MSIPIFLSFQMSVIPSVQPFHAIAYPLDPILALDIRSGTMLHGRCVLMSSCSSIILLTFCPFSSRKYAAHCSVIAARYSLPPFNHPAPLPIKGGNRTGRLRIGYVLRRIFLACIVVFVSPFWYIYRFFLFTSPGMSAATLVIIPYHILWAQYLACTT